MHQPRRRFRRKDADTVSVELGTVQDDAQAGMAMSFGSHTIEVPEADTPALGTPVTLTFTVQP
jgi:hypothetical protein